MRFYIRWAWRAAFVSAVLTIMGASSCLAWQQGRDDDLEPGTFLIAPRRAADPSFASRWRRWCVPTIPAHWVW